MGLRGGVREIVVRDLLRPLLPAGIGIGSGEVISAGGLRSRQTDIVLYDRRILPSIVHEGTQGMFPVESVLYAIEVKSRLMTQHLAGIEEAAGEDSCALRVDGTMACWGTNNWGVLGTGDRVPSLTPHLVPGLIGVTAIDAQIYRTCAGKADGSVYCWGSFSGLGDGTLDPRLSPTRVIGMP
jgi:Regulator of chromosome condensation (RCC1) repeat